MHSLSVNGGANCDPGAHSTSATDSFVGTKLLRVAAINSNRAPAEITCNLPSACKTDSIAADYAAIAQKAGG